MYDIKIHLMENTQSWGLGNVEKLFITITLTSTQA